LDLIMNSAEFSFGSLGERVNQALEQAQRENIAQRILQKDASVWTNEAAAAAMIRNSLGWLTVADQMAGVAGELREFAGDVRHRFHHVMVCGMGGSSLCPEVLARTFGKQNGFPELLVLDSTDPDVLASFLQRIEVEKCLFVIASKSGTTTEPNVFYKFWQDRVKSGENFVAITDPGTPLVQTAESNNFCGIFLNQADIGGRYSALSYFGMLPAALMGLDVRKLLGFEKKTDDAFKLGVAIGECANAGRDKLTLLIDPKLASLGLWIEQLIAESTGKQGKGILPVAGEPLGEPSVYGDDRVFVAISLGESDFDLDALAEAGHPIIHRRLNDLYDLGAEFFVWEFATACAGWRLGINPFDQPNVQEAKDVTKEVLAEFSKEGRLPDSNPPASLEDSVKQQLAQIKAGDYIAFLNYIEETPEINRKLQEIRVHLRNTTRCATTVGYGPRFQHSTGQLHKGGPNTGVFFQLNAKDKVDYPVPGEKYSFSILKEAQALGDFRALQTHGRRVVRVDLGDDLMAGLSRLEEAIKSA
jgi:transaldolase/glucose-6-phosphate isomerase